MKPTIVLAEDETVLRDAYVAILRHGGFEVFEAADGIEALDISEAERPDLLILDMLMPRMGGLEVLADKRLTALRPPLKVIAFTNLSDPETLRALESYAVDRYLLKSSVEPHMLIESVRQVLAGEAAAGRDIY